MPLFTVDEEKCDLCQICVSACPAGLVGMTADASVPTPIDRGDGACSDCGHCVAACPTEALSHQNAASEQCLPIRDELRISPVQIAQLMRARRSVRNFTDQSVARETIAELLNIARFAPSGCNAQPVHWLVVHDTKQVRQIAELVIGGLRQMIEREPVSPLGVVLGRLVAAWDEGADVVTRGAPHLVMSNLRGQDSLILLWGCELPVACQTI